MERRLLLVFVLTFLVIILFQPILKKYLPQPAQPAPAQKENQPSQPQAANPPPVVEPAAAAVPEKSATRQAAAESQIVIENDLYRITFTNRGAQVTSWVLKNFDDDHGKPLDLVNAAAAPKYGFPLSLWTYDETQRNKINSVLYASSESGTLRAPAAITFEYADQDLSVRKVFHFDHTTYCKLKPMFQ